MDNPQKKLFLKIVVPGQADVPLAPVGGGADVSQPPLPGIHVTNLFFSSLTLRLSKPHCYLGLPINHGRHCYKTFFVRILRIFLMS
jgi:hypothetical protein